MTMIESNPAGRVADEGFESATADKTVKDLLEEIIRELQQLRLALVRSGFAADVGNPISIRD